MEMIHKKNGRLHIYVRQDKYKGELKSHNWVGRTYINGKQKIISSGTTNLEEAIPILEKWYDDLQVSSEQKDLSSIENKTPKIEEPPSNVEEPPPTVVEAKASQPTTNETSVKTETYSNQAQATKVTPPPLHIGERIVPALALPVPFCFQGFFPPPLASDLFF